ncbi:MAG: hypothetical protein IJ583_04310, partial [Firmicutes bacterium]|nr:hypothetical protein [Bacillota bacterium]
ERTLENYMKIGAEMRLFKALSTRLVVEIDSVLSTKDIDKMLNAFNKIDEVCSKVEDNMFVDFPNLSDEYLDVFYGALNDKPRNDTDKRITEIAKEIAHELFRKGN